MSGMDDLDAIPERKAARAGRRAGGDEPSELPQKQKGGWDSGPSEEQLEAQQREQEKQFEERYFGGDVDDNAAGAASMIPALDGSIEKEIDVEDITKQVAEAPKNYSTQVQGLPDLEKDDTMRLPPSADDIDLSILHEVILADTAREEDDAEWVPSTLFHQLRLELQAEKDTNDTGSNASGDDATKEALAMMRETANAAGFPMRELAPSTRRRIANAKLKLADVGLGQQQQRRPNGLPLLWQGSSKISGMRQGDVTAKTLAAAGGNKQRDSPPSPPPPPPPLLPPQPSSFGDWVSASKAKAPPAAAVAAAAADVSHAAAGAEKAAAAAAAAKTKPKARRPHPPHAHTLSDSLPHVSTNMIESGSPSAAAGDVVVPASAVLPIARRAPAAPGVLSPTPLALVTHAASSARTTGTVVPITSAARNHPPAAAVGVGAGAGKPLSPFPVPGCPEVVRERAGGRRSPPLPPATTVAAAADAGANASIGSKLADVLRSGVAADETGGNGGESGGGVGRAKQAATVPAAAPKLPAAVEAQQEGGRPSASPPPGPPGAASASSSGGLLRLAGSRRDGPGEVCQVNTLLEAIRPLAEDVPYFCVQEGDPKAFAPHGRGGGGGGGGGAGAADGLLRNRDRPVLRPLLKDDAPNGESVESPKGLPKDAVGGGAATSEQQQPPRKRRGKGPAGMRSLHDGSNDTAGSTIMIQSFTEEYTDRNGKAPTVAKGAVAAAAVAAAALPPPPPPPVLDAGSPPVARGSSLPGLRRWAGPQDRSAVCCGAGGGRSVGNNRDSLSKRLAKHFASGDSQARERQHGAGGASGGKREGKAAPSASEKGGPGVSHRGKHVLDRMALSPWGDKDEEWTAGGGEEAAAAPAATGGNNAAATATNLCLAIALADAPFVTPLYTHPQAKRHQKRVSGSTAASAFAVPPAQPLKAFGGVIAGAGVAAGGSRGGRRASKDAAADDHAGGPKRRRSQPAVAGGAGGASSAVAKPAQKRQPQQKASSGVPQPASGASAAALPAAAEAEEELPADPLQGFESVPLGIAGDGGSVGDDDGVGLDGGDYFDSPGPARRADDAASSDDTAASIALPPSAPSGGEEADETAAASPSQQPLPSDDGGGEGAQEVGNDAPPTVDEAAPAPSPAAPTTPPRPPSKDEIRSTSVDETPQAEAASTSEPPPPTPPEEEEQPSRDAAADVSGTDSSEAAAAQQPPVGSVTDAEAAGAGAAADDAAADDGDVGAVAAAVAADLGAEAAAPVEEAEGGGDAPAVAAVAAGGEEEAGLVADESAGSLPGDEEVKEDEGLLPAEGETITEAEAVPAEEGVEDETGGAEQPVAAAVAVDVSGNDAPTSEIPEEVVQADGSSSSAHTGIADLSGEPDEVSEDIAGEDEEETAASESPPPPTQPTRAPSTPDDPLSLSLSPSPSLPTPIPGSLPSTAAASASRGTNGAAAPPRQEQRQRREENSPSGECDSPLSPIGYVRYAKFHQEDEESEEGPTTPPPPPPAANVDADADANDNAASDRASSSSSSSSSSSDNNAADVFGSVMRTPSVEIRVGRSSFAAPEPEASGTSPLAAAASAPAPDSRSDSPRGTPLASGPASFALGRGDRRRPSALAPTSSAPPPRRSPSLAGGKMARGGAGAGRRGDSAAAPGARGRPPAAPAKDASGTVAALVGAASAAANGAVSQHFLQAFVEQVEARLVGALGAAGDYDGLLAASAPARRSLLEHAGERLANMKFRAILRHFCFKPAQHPFAADAGGVPAWGKPLPSPALSALSALQPTGKRASNLTASQGPASPAVSDGGRSQGGGKTPRKSVNAAPSVGVGSVFAEEWGRERESEKYSALLIGVEEYADKRVGDCAGVNADLAVLRAVLQAYGYKVDVMHTGHAEAAMVPTRKNVLAMLNAYRTEKERRKGQHFVYFCGRTIFVEENWGGGAGRVQMLPADYKPPVNSMTSPEEGLELAELRVTGGGKGPHSGVQTGDDQQFVVLESHGAPNGLWGKNTEQARHGFAQVCSTKECSDFKVDYGAHQRSLVSYYLAKALEGSAMRDGKITNVSINHYLKAKLLEVKPSPREHHIRSCSEPLAVGDLQAIPARLLVKESFEEKIERAVMPGNYCLAGTVDAAAYYASPAEFRRALAAMFTRLYHGEQQERREKDGGLFDAKTPGKKKKKQSADEDGAEAKSGGAAAAGGGGGGSGGEKVQARPAAQRREAAHCVGATLAERLGVAAQRVVSVSVGLRLLVMLAGHEVNGGVLLELSTHKKWEEEVLGWFGDADTRDVLRKAVRVTVEPVKGAVELAFEGAQEGRRMLRKVVREVAEGTLAEVCGHAIETTRVAIEVGCSGSVKDYLLADKALRLGRLAPLLWAEGIAPWHGTAAEHAAATRIQSTYLARASRVSYRLTRSVLFSERDARAAVTAKETHKLQHLWDAFQQDKVEVLHALETYLRGEYEQWKHEDFALIVGRVAKDHQLNEAMLRFEYVREEERNRFFVESEIVFLRTGLNSVGAYPFHEKQLKIASLYFRKRVLLEDEEKKAWSTVSEELRRKLPKLRA